MESEKTYKVTIDSGFMQGDPPADNADVANRQDYIDAKMDAEESWPENQDPRQAANAQHVDSDWIEVEKDAELVSTDITTDPGIDDVDPQIIVKGDQSWHYRWQFSSVITFEYE